MEKLKLGVLGIGGHFIQRVLNPLLASDAAELYAVASRSKEKADNLARRYGIPRSYGSYEELLADPAVEAVYMPLPNHLHVEFIKKAADAGKHILCEKPLGLNYREAYDAVEYTRAKGVVLIEAFMYRFHPQWARVREIVRSGEIGTVMATSCVFSYDNRDPSNIRNVLSFGGGAILDIGVYAVSSARYVMDAEPDRVLCNLVRDKDFGTDVLASGILDFGGRRSLFTVGTQLFPAQRVDVVGTGGSISVEVPFNMYPDVPGRVTVRTGVGERVVLTDIRDQYGLEIAGFVRAIRSHATLPIGPEDTLANMRVIDALFRSGQNEGWENLR